MPTTISASCKSNNNNDNNNDNNNSSGEEGDESRKKRGNSERKKEPENSKKVRSENTDNDSGIGDSNVNINSCNVHDSKENRSDGRRVVNEERIEGETSVLVPTTTTATTRCMDSDSSSTMRMAVNNNSSPSTSFLRHDNHDDGSNRSNRNWNTGEQQRKRQRDEVWDLESALMYLVQIGSSSNNNNNNNNSKNNNNKNAIEKNKNHAGNSRHGCSKKIGVDCKGSGVEKEKEKSEWNAHGQDQDSNFNSYRHGRAHDYSNSECEEAAVSREYLALEKNSWITFRAAHAGDASSIAQWYLRKRLEERSHKCVVRQRQQHRSRTILDGSSTRDYGSNHDNDESDTNSNKEEEEVSDHEDPEIDKYPILRHATSASDEEEPSSDPRTHIRSKFTNAAGGDEQESHATNGEECDDNEEGVHSSSLQLEHWLAEGLGDENTCPSVYGLLAYVHHRLPNEGIGKHSNQQGNVADTDTDGRGDSSAVSNLPSPEHSKSPPPPTTTTTSNDDDDLTQFCSNNLAVVVLLSLSWTSGKRNLRIEWMSVDANQLQTEDEVLAVQQKVWLRIHTLSVMTACQAIAVDENVLLTTRTAATAMQEHRHQQFLSSSSSPVSVYNEEEPLDDKNRTKPGSKNGNSTVPTHSNQMAPSAE